MIRTGQVVCSFATTQFEFHPAHNHWHIGSAARFAVHKATDDGRGGGVGAVFVNNLGVAQSFKTTFCLIDWVKIQDNTKTPERTYFECDRDAPFQGVSVGWIDQYHHSLEGQEIDFTGAPVRRVLPHGRRERRRGVHREPIERTTWHGRASD